MDIKLNKEEQRVLLALARAAIAEQHPVLPHGAVYDQAAGAFVSLHKHGSLRGCIGRMQAIQSLASVVVSMARAAAYEDSRFPPLRSDELPSIRIEISVLSPMESCSIEDIQVGKHGVLLSLGYHSAVFLPQVAPEQGWDRTTMLKHLCAKAGLAPDAYLRPDAQLAIFTALVFSEPTVQPHQPLS